LRRFRVENWQGTMWEGLVVDGKMERERVTGCCLGCTQRMLETCGKTKNWQHHNNTDKVTTAWKMKYRCESPQGS
jgi:hypothetical protein